MSTPGPVPQHHQAFAAADKVLAVRLDALGDVLMTTPALHAIRESGRRRHVTLLTSPSGAAAAHLIDAVDDVIIHDAPWMKATSNRPDAETDRQFITTLARQRFDAAVIFTVYSQNPLPAALMCYLADIPQRLAHCRENPYQLLTAWVRETDPGYGPAAATRHEAQRQLDLVAAVGWRTDDDRLRLTVPQSALGAIDLRLRDLGLDRRPWVAVHPGASAPSRRYPEQHFAEVIARLTREHDFDVVLTGSAGEAELLARLATHGGTRAHTLAGQLDLAGLAALVRRAPLLISNNTGPVHVAAAVGTPVVDLYALTNPQHTPWRVPSRVLNRDVPCRNCYRSVCPEGHHLCLRGVEPRQVVAAALELWALEGGSRHTSVAGGLAAGGSAAGESAAGGSAEDGSAASGPPAGLRANPSGVATP